MLSLYHVGEVILLLAAFPTYLLYAVELHTIASPKYGFRHSPFHLLFFAVGLIDCIMIPFYEYSFKFQYWFPSIASYGSSNNALSVLWYFGMTYSACVVYANLFFVAVNRVTAVLIPLKHTRIWQPGVYYAIGASFVMGLIPTLPCFQMVVIYKPYVENNVTQLVQYIDNYWVEGLYCLRSENNISTSNYCDVANLQYLPGTYAVWYSVALICPALIMHLITGILLCDQMRGNPTALLRSERSLLILSLVLILPNCAMCIYNLMVAYLNNTGQNELLNGLFLCVPFIVDADVLHRPWVLMIADTPLRGAVMRRMRGWLTYRTETEVAAGFSATILKRPNWLRKAEIWKNKQSISFVLPTTTTTTTTQ